MTLGRRQRARECLFILVGWCCVPAAWTIGMWPASSVAINSSGLSNTVKVVSPSQDADLMSDFYQQLSADIAMTGDQAVGRLAAWNGSREQRERMLADGERKLIEGEAMTEPEWLQKATRFRMGAEAIVVAGAGVPRKLEYAGDACVAAGDLLFSNGREEEAGFLYTRAISVYELILTTIGTSTGDFHDRIGRKRNAVGLSLERQSKAAPTNEPRRAR